MLSLEGVWSIQVSPNMTGWSTFIVRAEDTALTPDQFLQSLLREPGTLVCTMMGIQSWSLDWSQVTTQVVQSASTTVLATGDVLGASVSVMPSGQGRIAPPAFVLFSAVDTVTMVVESVTVRLAGRGMSAALDMMSVRCQTATDMGSAQQECASVNLDGLDQPVKNVSIS